ncbi:MAG: hypothetical protein WBL40_05330, partial [Terrimicrobiaceae bacterium]
MPLAVSLGFRFVAGDQAVAQAGVGDGLHVGGRGGVTAVKPGFGPGGAVEGEGAARARADFDPLRELRVSVKSPGRRVAAMSATMYF